MADPADTEAVPQRCQQCGRPPVHAYKAKGGLLLLCLDCSLKYQQIADMRIADLERQQNHTMDMLDAVWGIPSGFPRYPTRRPRPMVVHGGTTNNIHVQNSTIGVLNTGAIERADVAIGAIARDGGKELADVLKALTEALAATTELQPTQRNDALEMVSVVAAEASQPPDQRRSAIVRPVLGALGDIVKLAPGLIAIWNQAHPVLESLFK